MFFFSIFLISSSYYIIPYINSIMNKYSDFSHINVKNPLNKYIVDEFIKYYKFCYSNYSNSSKTPKEMHYKLLSISKIINIIAKLSKHLTSSDMISNIKGVGPKTISRVDEIINTKKLSEISNNNNIFNSISELSSIYGIGPVKASVFYKKFNIKTIQELIDASNKGLISLTNQMKLGIKYKNSLIEQIPHDLIKSAEIHIINKIKSIDKNLICVFCGSYRRLKPFSSDIDILISHKLISSTNDPNQTMFLNNVIDVLSNYFIVDKLTLSSNKHFQGFASFKNIISKKFPNFDIKNSVIRLDIIIVPYVSFFTALMHFTGSASFNQKMRLHAKTLNMKLSEYALYDNNTKSQLTIKSEHDIFNNLLLKYIPPEKR